jgi:hypothetical protein
MSNTTQWTDEQLKQFRWGHRLEKYIDTAEIDELCSAYPTFYQESTIQSKNEVHFFGFNNIKKMRDHFLIHCSVFNDLKDLKRFLMLITIRDFVLVGYHILCVASKSYRPEKIKWSGEINRLAAERELRGRMTDVEYFERKRIPFYPSEDALMDVCYRIDCWSKEPIKDAEVIINEWAATVSGLTIDYCVNAIRPILSAIPEKMLDIINDLYNNKKLPDGGYVLQEVLNRLTKLYPETRNKPSPQITSITSDNTSNTSDNTSNTSDNTSNTSITSTNTFIISKAYK